ncbi:MAG: GNAT family N-acetyltransferase [Magnetococcales bacterium]|nr:GNAT family N-acetyltransferase [Magnetococcales bacterium]
MAQEWIAAMPGIIQTQPLPEWQVTWVDTVEAIAESLWESCFPPPLEGLWWYRALQHSGLQDQFRFCYAVVSHNGQAVAIAPAFVMDVPLAIVAPPWTLPMLRLLERVAPSWVRQRTLFIGSPCSEQGSVGMLPGVDRERVMVAIQESLLERARLLRAVMVVWKDFARQDGPLFAKLLDRMFAMVSYPGTVCPLPATKEAYFAALSANRRHQLKKKLRLSAAAVAVELSIVRQPDQETLREIFALFWQTYQRAATRFEELNETFFQQIALADPARFILLREKSTQQLLAFMLCFQFPGYVINKFVGFDYHRPRQWLLYFRLWEAVLDWSLAIGATCIQSGQTVYAAKIAVGHQLVPLTNYALHRHPLLHWLYGRIAPTISWQSLDGTLAEYLQAHSAQTLTAEETEPFCKVVQDNPEK